MFVPHIFCVSDIEQTTVSVNLAWLLTLLFLLLLLLLLCCIGCCYKFRLSEKYNGWLSSVVWVDRTLTNYDREDTKPDRVMTNSDDLRCDQSGLYLHKPDQNVITALTGPAIATEFPIDSIMQAIIW